MVCYDTGVSEVPVICRIRGIQLRCAGFSYGTALGVTVAAMFPDRMDKVVLDGVLNPTQYYEGR